MTYPYHYTHESVPRSLRQTGCVSQVMKTSGISGEAHFHDESTT
jgi:hypothetical protein